jgi:GTPase
MPVPRIAIVGRPNVGKSSLLNLLAKDKVSIVDPTAGTTRDRVSILADLMHPDDGVDSTRVRTVEITDTGGYGVYVTEGKRFNEVGADLSTLTRDIEHQISEAVAGADLVLFVIDAQAGVTPQDEEVARLLRERVLGKKDRDLRVLVVANKCDGPKWEAHALEAANLGFGEPLAVSAKNNYFRRDFLDALYNAVASLPGADEPATIDTPEMKIAIIGKRNAGKSSLVNALAGEQRVIVSEIAGTTRDAVDVRFEIDGHTFVAIDTAGLRKKKSFQDSIEWFAFDRAKRSIDRADVVMLLLDATEPVSQVDQQLAMMTQKAYKPVVIVVNKWDMVEGRSVVGGQDSGKPVTPERYEEYLRKELSGVTYAPIAFVSAKSGLNVRGAVELATELHAQASVRASTGQLNRLVRRVLETRGPSSKLGTFIKTYFVAQVAVKPPTIVLVVNRPELFTINYQKFLINRLRETLPFAEVPIKLIVKERKRARMEDLLSGEYARMKQAADADGGTHAPELDAEVAEGEGALEGVEALAPGAEPEHAEVEQFGEGVLGPGEEVDLDDLPDDAEPYFDDEKA